MRHVWSYQLISTIMSSPTVGQGSSISQHLHATKKTLQGVVFNPTYVRGVKMHCVGGLTHICRVTGTLGAAEVK